MEIDRRTFAKAAGASLLVPSLPLARPPGELVRFTMHVGDGISTIMAVSALAVGCIAHYLDGKWESCYMTTAIVEPEMLARLPVPSEELHWQEIDLPIISQDAWDRYVAG